MSRKVPRLTLAALRGGSGKTTVSLGLIAAWRRMGLRIVPFKKGPDYIDAGWLAQAAGSPCFNLDPFLMSREQVLRSFSFRAGQTPDCALIEGNRGLFDGFDQAGTYSTAELAKLLGAPTVIVVDCTKATRTLAAVVFGCQHFDPDLTLSGVILNEVATSRQEALVRIAIENETGVEVLGAVPRIRSHDLPERHLGLIPHQEHPTANKALDIMADIAAGHIDLDRIMEVARTAPDLDALPADAWVGPGVARRPKVRIGVIQDSIFQFYYPENLEALTRLGAEVVIFSSLTSQSLPQVDALYLGGGFPETQAEVLADNHGLRRDIRLAAANGLPIYAECGGLMFLGRELVVKEKTFPMAGVFPVTFGLEKRPQGHGYTVVAIKGQNAFFQAGEKFSGHEFHYSRPLEYDNRQFDLVMEVERGHGFDQGKDGLSYKNVLASYTHLHALGTTRWAEALVGLAVKYNEEQQKRLPMETT